MFQFVLRDYRYRFWPSCINYALIIFIYILNFYVNMIMIWRLDVVKYSIGMLPMMLGLLLSRMFPNQLQKQMYLCPMSARDRKKYLFTAYAVRFGGVGILYRGGSLAALITGRITRWEFTAVSALVLFFLLGVNMHHVLFGLLVVRREGEKNYWLSIIYATLSLLVQLTALVTMIYFAYTRFGEQRQHADLGILSGMVGINVLLNIVVCVICYKPVIRYGINYESCYVNVQKIQTKTGMNYENCYVSGQKMQTKTGRNTL